jgi:chemotaxis protein CheD
VKQREPFEEPALPCLVKASDVILQPGEYFVGGGCRVRTLLGSCVSITLWHPQRRIGAMSHFVLAERGHPHVTTPDARYGEEALGLMIAELEQLRVSPTECDAKIFGGGDMFSGKGLHVREAHTVGRRNGEAARAMLESREITVRSQHLYGDGHRQIVFDVSNGHVWVRHVKPNGHVAPRLNHHGHGHGQVHSQIHRRS